MGKASGMIAEEAREQQLAVAMDEKRKWDRGSMPFNYHVCCQRPKGSL